MPLAENTLAPYFSLPDKDNKLHSLSKIKSKYSVLYFYPKDNTPGCTLEAVDFTKLRQDFKNLGAEIIGISGGDAKTKTKFCQKNNLYILLLSDADFTICKKYGCFGEKSFLGKKYFGIQRTSFVIHNKKIIKVYENVSAVGHAKEVLAFLKNREK
ncbi:MAG: peroxiredoxin [Nanoarchaeota archaeon]